MARTKSVIMSKEETKAETDTEEKADAAGGESGIGFRGKVGRPARQSSLRWPSMLRVLHDGVMTRREAMFIGHR